MGCPIVQNEDKCASCGAFVESKIGRVAHVISAHVAPLLELCGNVHEHEQLVNLGKHPNIIDPKPEVRLPQTAPLPVVSIPPSDHVLVTASYKPANKSLTVACITEPNAAEELPVLTGLQMFMRVTSEDDDTATSQAQPDGETAASAQKRQFNTTTTAWMTRAEHSALRMWVDALKGVWKQD